MDSGLAAARRPGTTKPFHYTFVGAGLKLVM
jgi:hypothetical protein